MNFTFGHTLQLVPTDVLEPISTTDFIDNDPFYLSPSRIEVEDTGPMSTQGLKSLSNTVGYPEKLRVAIENWKDYGRETGC